MSWWIAIFCFIIGWAARGLSAGWPARIADAHHRLWCIWWRHKSRNKGGRPRIDPELIALIRRMSLECPLWGAPRIHGELLKLGFRVAQSTVSRYMIPRRGRPTLGWLTFLRLHADAIVGIDMLCVPTLGLRRLYAFVVLGHGRRKILHVEVTSHPTALWLAHQIADAFREQMPQSVILIRDNDGAYGLVFRRRLRAMGIRDRPTSPHAPWQNGHAERLIGSIRRDCLHHLTIVNASHLRRVLRRYVLYYNADRTHLALDKDSPLKRAVEARGRIMSAPAVGGLHRRYRRSLRD
jgi:transposase InsO family protein